MLCSCTQFFCLISHSADASPVGLPSGGPSLLTRQLQESWRNLRSRSLPEKLVFEVTDASVVQEGTSKYVVSVEEPCPIAPAGDPAEAAQVSRCVETPPCPSPFSALHHPRHPVGDVRQDAGGHRATLHRFCTAPQTPAAPSRRGDGRRVFPPQEAAEELCG